MHASGLSPLAPLRSSSGEALTSWTDLRPSARRSDAASSRAKATGPPRRDAPAGAMNLVPTGTNTGLLACVHFGVPTGHGVPLRPRCSVHKGVLTQ